MRAWVNYYRMNLEEAENMPFRTPGSEEILEWSTLESDICLSEHQRIDAK